MSYSVPMAEIAWKILPRIASYIAKRFIFEVELAEGNNPSISVFFETARVRYKLLIKTHGSPKFARKKARFPQVKNLGEITKKAVSPVALGEIEGLKLKFCTDEMPANTDVELFVDFDVRVDGKKLVAMNFTRDINCMTRENPEIEVLAHNNCSFPLEQILLEIDKSPDFQINDVDITILDPASHNLLAQIDNKSIIKGGDKIKWVTCLTPEQSLLFRIVPVIN